MGEIGEIGEMEGDGRRWTEMEGDGEMGRWGDGEMGRWGDGETIFCFFFCLV